MKFSLLSFALVALSHDHATAASRVGPNGSEGLRAGAKNKGGNN